MVCGIKLPAGLKEAQKLPEVIFTPATKAPAGSTTRTSPSTEAAKIVGARARGEGARGVDPALQRGRRVREDASGIIIADTKFEFGVDAAGKLC